MYDFSAMMAQAQEVVDNSNQGSSYKYQILYPGPGTTTVRLLFNPKSGISTRTIQRHRVGDTQVPCLRTYGQECPICKAIENIKNATNVDLKCRSQTRGISFAQFVSADHKVGSDRNPIKQGDVVLLMYPWSVYSEFNKFIQMISQNPASMQEIFTKCTGPVHNISRDENNKYSIQLNPYAPYQSAPTDEEFYAFIDAMDSLTDQILPATPTPEMIDQVTKTAKSLEDEYLNVAQSPNLNNPQVGQAMDMNAMYANMAQAQPQYTTINPSAPTTTDPNQTIIAQSGVATQSASSGMPTCYGNHNPTDMNCMVCPVEMQCKGTNLS